MKIGIKVWFFILPGVTATDARECISLKNIWHMISNKTQVEFKKGGLHANLDRSMLFVDLLFYVHGKHLRSCRDGQLT